MIYIPYSFTIGANCFCIRMFFTLLLGSGDCDVGNQLFKVPVTW